MSAKPKSSSSCSKSHTSTPMKSFCPCRPKANAGPPNRPWRTLQRAAVNFSSPFESRLNLPLGLHQRTPSPMRQWNVIRRAALEAASVCLALSACHALAAANSSLDSLLSGVEHRYNQARTLSVDFTETYSVAGRNHRPESGRLVLRKPGRMRWTYSDPAGKLFVSDGKTVYLYTAADNRVERSTLKSSDDLRAPMAFLLGRLNLKNDFRGFETNPAPNGTYLIAEAKSDRLPYGKIRMLIGTDLQIQELTIDGRDGSVLGFVFRNEKLNPPVPDTTFHFTIPAGAELVDAINSPSGDN
jgi:outer membrane lipoprotein carrier protein